MSIAWKLVAPPAAEPLSADDVATHLRILSGDIDPTEGAKLQALITAARVACENRTRRALVTQQWLLVQDTFTGWDQDRRRDIHLPKGRLQSVDSIQYIDMNGVRQTLDPSQYDVDTITEPARVRPVYGAYWPVARLQNNAVQVTFTCGYGGPGENNAWQGEPIPETLKLGMLMLIDHWYEYRGLVDPTANTPVPFAVEMLFQGEAIETDGVWSDQ